MGDFNKILECRDKWGSNPCPTKAMDAFRCVFDDCGLHDLGFSGPKYTWCNNREGDACISERIDQFLANNRRDQIYPRASVLHGYAAYFDHLPIWLSLEGRGKKIAHQRRFKHVGGGHSMSTDH